MNRWLYAASDFLARPPGFWWTLATLIIGSLYAWFGGVDVVTYWLSVYAIVGTGLVLVNTSRDTAALHAKLDELLRAKADARNEFIGLERDDMEQIEEKRADVERSKEER